MHDEFPESLRASAKRRSGPAETGATNTCAPGFVKFGRRGAASLTNGNNSIIHEIWK
jgi:hypothetical protein